MKARDLIQKQPPKVLIYGPPGTGKTGLIAQASGGYLADSDKGMRTALNLQDKWTKYRHNIEFDQFLDLDPKKPQAWIKFKEQVFRINREIREGKWPYDAFCMDSLTNFGIAAMANVMHMSQRDRPQIQDWGTAIDDMRNILRLITSWPVLVLVATHEQPFTDENENIRAYKPKSLGVKLCDEVVCMFDEVWLTKTKKKPATQGHADLIVSWLPQPMHETRTRSGSWKEFSIIDTGLRELLKETGFEYNHEPE